jgi:hypothetical protein
MHDQCTPNWYRLIPDKNGSYINGSWSELAVGDKKPLAPMIGSGTTADGYGPLYYASQVLPDGRLIVMGGEAENSTGTCSTSPAADSTKGSLYNPHANTWSAVPCPGSTSSNSCTGINAWANIGDSASVLLGPNTITGTYAKASFFLQNCCQSILAAVATIAPFPGTTVTWTQTTNGKADANNEEGWTLLPNGTVMAVDVGASPGTELFFPSQNCPTPTQCNGQWVSAGNTAPNLISTSPPSEIGPAVSIGYNMVVQFGGNPSTSVFVYPTGNINSTVWTVGPSFPTREGGNPQEVADGPAALLPNGNILVQSSQAYKGSYDGRPSHFWEFSTAGMTPQTPGVGTLTEVNHPACNDKSLANTGSYEGRMLVLPATADAPNGQVLWDAGPDSAQCTFIYVVDATDGTPNRVMRPLPHINSISSTTLTQGGTNYTLIGSMFRDVSQGASYGDDAQMATNYPIVRITNNTSNRVCWGRTHDWEILTSTQFDIPPATTPASDWALVENGCDNKSGGGVSTLVVIVNGLVSNPMAVTIQ